ncbi:hypothetical protein [Prosthecobacter sp.]|uniref:hypothetical protein n=1 Tax=Prosthecobacter sp. TaxID=1965333 RepID=UPI003784C94E
MRPLLCLFALAAPLGLPALHAADQAPFKKEELHALIREVAARIEEKYKGSRPEADGLVQHVEEILMLPEPPPPSADDRPSMLARKMTLLTDRAGFTSSIGGVRGAVFDNTDTGFMQRYHDLESTDAQDAEEVWRWLEMADAARRLKWSDKAETCTQRALGAARALVSRQPKNAEAHALLGLALEWSSEKLATLQTALKLDARQPLALHEMLDRRLSQALEAAALRREVALEEKSLAYQTVARALHERALTEEETLAFERRQEELRHELVQLLALAQERHDLTVYIKTVGLLSELRQNRKEVALAARRPQDESFERFLARLALMLAANSLTVFEDDELLRTSLNLAAEDPETTGTIVLLTIIGDGMRAQTTRQKPAESRMDQIRLAFGRLTEMAAADDTPRAARAAEAAFILELGLMMVIQREPTRMDLLLRAIHLDPFRQRTQHMLTALCAGMLPKFDDPAAAAALTLTELALLPSRQTRRTCAAALSRVRDWPAAQRYLDACLREEPDHLSLLSQKAVTILRESQSKAAQKKAQIYFQKIDSLREKTGAKPDNDDLQVITRNHILFLMISGKNDAAREELASAKRDKILDDKECQELEKLLP